ncbi:DUF4401 domain-containing protein [Spartinivicinus poritis]|uniref:DUF4401 domain-containing protein n=1 Tax=Spartinivicinus poritis TaxID=2994640 RepID=A0ABT5U611_9GAMM|nr:DUF4401 domain-containing protein [Spartinivicinus sp. A2-2]MDE1461799.1 DUF4401 domain-containing protein [Spartinivicinus sp. A2-2]
MLAKLADQSLIIGSPDKLKHFVIAQQQAPELPLYIRCLIGVGALIVSFCFIAFLYIAEIIQFKSEPELIIWGLAFAALAIGLLKMAGEEHNAKQSFFIQSSFVAMAMGKILFVTGIGIATKSVWGVTCATLVITLLTYPIYQISIDRFLSGLAVLASIIVNILWDRDLAGVREVVFNAFLFVKLLIAAFLLCYGKVKRYLIPLSYSFVFSIAWAVLILMDTSKFGYGNQQEVVSTMLPSYMLSISLVAVIGWVAGGFSKLKKIPLVLAVLVSIVLGLLSVPGIILSIILLILGYAKYENILTIIGALLLPYCLVVFYYNLDITLLHKSILLVMSGLVLLVGRFCITYQGWDKCQKNY